jgi:hypothetical protein
MTMSHTQEARRQNGSTPPPGTSSAASADVSYQTDAANYIAAMIAELRQISDKAGFEKLIGALDAAYYEAYALQEPKASAPATPEEKNPPPVEPSSS